MHRADLLDVLAGALPAGLVTLGRRCTRVWPDGDVAVARFADGSEIEAVVVGANGIHSPVRASLFGPDAPWRRRVHPGDPEGRGAAWLADYDASSPDVLADGGPASPGSTTAVG